MLDPLADPVADLWWYCLGRREHGEIVTDDVRFGEPDRHGEGISGQRAQTPLDGARSIGEDTSLLLLKWLLPQSVDCFLNPSGTGFICPK
jgi:hypothetical protein